MQYLQPFLYFARKPKTGLNNLLVGCLAPLIPIVGEMVLLGYRAQVSEELERDPELKDHPDLKLDDLMIYLKRGVWPYLARLVFMFAVLPVILPMSFLSAYFVYQLSGEMVLAVGVGYLLAFGLFLLTSVVLWPMEYHAQVTQRFAPLEELKFAVRFLRVCGFSAFISVLMFTMFGAVTMLIGALLCYIGLYPATVIVNMAEQHMMTQLYLHYLDEGGEPLKRPDVLDDEDDRPRRGRLLAEED